MDVHSGIVNNNNLWILAIKVYKQKSLHNQLFDYQLSMCFKRWCTSRRTRRLIIRNLGTVLSIPWPQSSQEPIIPSPINGGRWRRRRNLPASMVGRKTVLETHGQLARFTGAGIRKRQNLLAPFNGTNRFLLLLRITISRLVVSLQDWLVVVSGGLDRHGTCFADDNLPAVMVGIRATMRLVRSVFETEEEVTAVACEREEIELVAIVELAVFSQIWKSFSSTRRHWWLPCLLLNLISERLNWIEEWI